MAGRSVVMASLRKSVAVVRQGGKVLQLTLVNEQADWKVAEPLPPGF
jgi:hypothetical protein